MKKFWSKVTVGLIVMAMAVAALGVTQSAAAGKSTLELVKERGVLRVATAPGYFPFEMIDKDGKIIGFDIDMARAIAQELGVKLEVIPFEWAGIIPALTTGKADLIIAGMTITPQRAEKVSFTIPYFRTGQAMIVNKKHKGVKSWADMDKEGMKIGVNLGQTGDFAAEKFFKKAQIVKFQGSENLALAVATGKVDAGIHDQPWILITAKKHSGTMYALPEPQTVEDLGIALPHGDTEFKNWLDAFLKDFLNSPKYKELYNYWFIDMPWMAE